MAATVLMPKLGNTVESSVIVAWKKAVGERVAAGEVLLEVETDKATVEVESTAAGVVLALLAKPGDDVAVLAPIAVVGQVGEQPPAIAGSPAVAGLPGAGRGQPPRLRQIQRLPRRLPRRRSLRRRGGQPRLRRAPVAWPSARVSRWQGCAAAGRAVALSSATCWRPWPRSQR